MDHAETHLKKRKHQTSLPKSYKTITLSIQRSNGNKQVSGHSPTNPTRERYKQKNELLQMQSQSSLHKSLKVVKAVQVDVLKTQTNKIPKVDSQGGAWRERCP